MKKSSARKSVAFSANPVLAVRLPMWRSRVVCSCCSWLRRAGRARALAAGASATQFLQKQGEIRYERTLELPATRGKILDRNGQVLASSAAGASAIWAIPEDVPDDAGADKLATRSANCST